jgi:hypothetical protein
MVMMLMMMPQTRERLRWVMASSVQAEIRMIIAAGGEDPTTAWPCRDNRRRPDGRSIPVRPTLALMLVAAEVVVVVVEIAVADQYYHATDQPKSRYANRSCRRLPNCRPRRGISKSPTESFDEN